MSLSSDLLREVLHYDPKTGLWTWLVDPARGLKRAGKLAGSIRPDGYRKITIAKRHYRSARLAWLYMTGEWPENDVDHKNRDRSDDRWANLREATRSQNKANGPGWGKFKKGVAALGAGRYRAQIMKDGVSYHIGCYDTEAEAHAAYVDKAKELFGSFYSAE